MEPAQAVDAEIDIPLKSLKPSSDTAANPTMRTSNPNASKLAQLTEQIEQTDISRINGYLRLANIAGGASLFILGVVGLFTPYNYADLVVAAHLMLCASILVAFEFRDKIPSWAELAKTYFGFYFQPLGRAIFLFMLGFLSFAEGTWGFCLGMMFIGLAGFNFFLIYRHPAYQQLKTNNETNRPASMPGPVAVVV